MLQHRTTDPAKHAEHIAERVAQEVWLESHSFDQWLATWFAVYEQALRELSASN